MAKVSVVLSGCGHLDGAEIRESLFTLLCLDQKNIKVEVFAPDQEQFHVINHLNGEVMDEKRNALVEAARIMRGKISPLSDLNPDNFDALIMPGGFGMAKNLSNFAQKGDQGVLNKKLSSIIKEFHITKKPICAICISPALLAIALKNEEIEITIGNDEETIETLEKMSVKHIKKSITDFHFDEKNLLLTTPAYMYGTGKLSNVFEGISKTIQKLETLVHDDTKKE